jgi:metallophosphoesterase superfamily enzyme
LAEWRERQNDLNIVLVAGNHDLQAGPPPEEWRIEGVGEPWELPPFICCHRPRPSRDEFVLAGHLHPGFRLSERNRSGLTAVCFYFGARVAVLPAFGNFTGKALINAQKGEQVFVIAGTEVIDVSRLLP